MNKFSVNKEIKISNELNVHVNFSQGDFGVTKLYLNISLDKNQMLIVHFHLIMLSNLNLDHVRRYNVDPLCFPAHKLIIDHVEAYFCMKKEHLKNNW